MAGRGHFPAWPEIVPAFSISALVCYSWTVVAFLRSLTVNWVLFLRSDEVLAVASYLLVSAFFESALLTALLVLLSGVLPRGLLAERFRLRASLLSLSLLGSIAAYMQFFEIRDLATNGVTWLLWWLAAAAGLVLSANSAPRFAAAVETLADRSIVLLYLFLPVTAGGLATIIVRNLK
jgi:hypothetical protein